MSRSIFSWRTMRTVAGLLSVFLVFLFAFGTANVPLYALGTSSTFTNTATGDATPTPAPVDGSLDSLSTLTSDEALAVSTGRGMTLYSNLSLTDNVTNIPAASKTMTAVIALESLPLDTVVTISSVAEELDTRSSSPLNLIKGEKFTVEFLVTAVLYRDSDAAALSLAEYISGNESSFVKGMNEMAKSLDMKNTYFLNTSGKEVLKSQSSTDSDQKNPTLLQHTTTQDLSLLFRYALNISSFHNIFTENQSRMFFPDGTTHVLTNSMTSAYGLTPQMKGAARFDSDASNSTSCVLALASAEDFEVVVILSRSQTEAIYRDLYTLVSAIYNHYEVSNLVLANGFYRDIAINGIPNLVPAVFESNVPYIHPKGVDYILPEVKFVADESARLPISKGDSLGQVIFTLRDGTSISTDVVAAEPVWSNSTILSDTIAILDANRNLAIILEIAIGFFVLCVIFTLLKWLRPKIRPGNQSAPISNNSQNTKRNTLK